ncbi:MAG: sugar transferase [Clostridiales bacterium]|nr:sugar transferase [Clostridiales bacterium]
MDRKKSRSRFWHDLSVRSVKLLNIILICLPFAYIWINYYSHQVYGGEYGLLGKFSIAALYVFLYIVFVRIYDAFQISQVNSSELYYSQIIAIVLINVVFFVVFAALLRGLPDPVTYLGCTFIQLTVSSVWCLVVSKWYFKVFKRKKVVIIYDSIHNLNEIAKHEQFKRSFELIGAYDIDEVKTASDDERIKWLFEKVKGAEAVFVMELHSHERNAIVKYCVDNDISCYNEPKIGDILLRGSKQFNMYNLPVILVERYNPTPEYRIIKRLNDVLLACLTIVVTSPVFLITALAIKISDGGPVIYKQKRLTKNGRVFDIYKFRSMKIDAEENTGAVLSSGNDDPRVTKIGKLIRKTRIDELPQLINIIKGDMSIVGPRPERPEIAEKYAKELPEFRLRLQVRAGLTGYAQVYGRYDSDPYDKLCMDLHYISNAGLAEDVRIMFVTIKRILSKEPEGYLEDEDDKL